MRNKIMVDVAAMRFLSENGAVRWLAESWLTFSAHHGGTIGVDHRGRTETTTRHPTYVTPPHEEEPQSCGTREREGAPELVARAVIGTCRRS